MEMNDLTLALGAGGIVAAVIWGECVITAICTRLFPAPVHFDSDY